MANETKSNTAPQVKASAETDRLAQLEAQIANLQKLLAAQQPVLQPIKLDQDREQELKERQEELSRTCQERTQAIARKMWQDSPTEYPVRVADVPEIYIPARSSEEAKGRYDVLCGINGVDPKHRYQIGKPVKALNGVA